MADNSKYGNNRNVWRKSYGTGQATRPPQLTTYEVFDVVSEPVNFDPITGKPLVSSSITIDLQKTVRHRDFFKTFGISGPIIIGEYDEGLIHFNNVDTVSFNFNVTFSGSPYIVFSMEGEAAAVQNTYNLNIYGLSVTNANGIVGLSAPFSGTIRYRAAYAEGFPAYFYGKSGSTTPTSGWFVASANKLNPDNQSYLSASWSALLAPIPVLFQTPFDDNLNFDANVAVQPQAGTLNNAGVISNLSAPISSSIYILAVQ